MHTDRGISGAEGYLTRNDVVGICTKKGWFCDEESSDQYSRILAVSKDGIDVRDLAAIIWCCGEGDLLQDIEKDIADYLDRAKKDIDKREARIDGRDAGRGHARPVCGHKRGGYLHLTLMRT